MTKKYVIMRELEDSDGAQVELWDVVSSLDRAEDICLEEEQKEENAGYFFYYQQVISSEDN